MTRLEIGKLVFLNYKLLGKLFSEETSSLEYSMSSEEEAQRENSDTPEKE